MFFYIFYLFLTLNKRAHIFMKGQNLKSIYSFFSVALVQKNTIKAFKYTNILQKIKAFMLYELVKV